MADQLKAELWTSSSNEALKLFIADSEGAVSFPPVFTYPIFGDSETIYGYQGLEILLCFNHYTFRPFLNIRYDKKLEMPNVEDPKSKLLTLLSKQTVFKDEVKWVDEVKNEIANYQIPGQLVDDFEQDNESYEIYKLDLTSDSGLELHQRLQILVLLFIEAGSYIDSNDPLWNVYVLYKVSPNEKNTRSIIGFTTIYQYWKYPGAKAFDEGLRETRLKISQFIILPPYQGKGLGQLFYSRLFGNWLKNEEIVEIVVEDPNEQFDDMRDRADLSFLNKQLDLNLINTKLTPGWIELTRKKFKLEKRQFARLLEMILLYKLKHNTGSDSVKDVRLFIKRRLFEKNIEALSPLEEADRRDKLHTAYQSLTEDYYRILDGVRLRMKRSLTDDNDDVNDDTNDESASLEKSKKVRLNKQ